MLPFVFGLDFLPGELLSIVDDFILPIEACKDRTDVQVFKGDFWILNSFEECLFLFEIVLWLEESVRFRFRGRADSR